MTRDDIIRMAEESGIKIEIDWAGRPSTIVIKDGATYLRGVHELERFAALVAKREREACAKMFDGEVWAYDYREIAAAIRARGEA